MNVLNFNPTIYHSIVYIIIAYYKKNYSELKRSGGLYLFSKDILYNLPIHITISYLIFNKYYVILI